MNKLVVIVIAFSLVALNTAAFAAGISVTIDSSSPAFQVVVGENDSAVLGSIQLSQATGETVTINSLSVSLSTLPVSGSVMVGSIGAYDDNGVYFGYGVMSARNAQGISTTNIQCSNLQLLNSVNKKITLRCVISAVSPFTPGLEAAAAKLTVSTISGTGQTSSSAYTSTGSVTFNSLVQLKNQFSFAADPLPINGVGDGKLLRMRVGINASSSQTYQSSQLAQIAFNVVVTNGGIGDVGMYCFTDSSYSVPLSGLPSGLAASATPDSFGNVVFVPAMPLQFVTSPSADQPQALFYYLELRSQVVLQYPSTLVSVALLTETTPSPAIGLAPLTLAQQKASGANMIVSPNTMSSNYWGQPITNSQAGDADWLNGYLMDIPAGGIIQNRSDVPTPFVLSAAASASTAIVGDSVTYSASMTGGAGTPAALKLMNDTGVLATAPAGASTVSVTIPLTSVGKNTVVAVGSTTGGQFDTKLAAVTVTAPVVVTPPPPPPLKIDCVGSTSSPAIGDKVTYVLNLSGGSGNTSASWSDGTNVIQNGGSTFVQSYSTPGQHVAIVSVKDTGTGEVESAWAAVQVRAAAPAPLTISMVDANQATVIAGQPTAFGFVGQDAGPYSYSVRWGDGNADMSTDGNFSHTYLVEGGLFQPVFTASSSSYSITITKTVVIQPAGTSSLLIGGSTGAIQHDGKNYAAVIFVGSDGTVPSGNMIVDPNSSYAFKTPVIRLLKGKVKSGALSFSLKKVK